MTVCVSEFPCKYSFQERALVAFKPRPILFIMNKICLNQPWITNDMLEAKQKRRKWEKKARKSETTRTRQEFKGLVKNMISKAKADYYVNIINDCCGDHMSSSI